MTTASPGKQAIDYAEGQLGVHTVYENAQTARNMLDETLNDLSSLRDAKRVAEAALSDREMELSIEEHAAHPTISATAMKDHLKAVVWKDDVCKQLRESLLKLSNDIDGLELDKSMYERDIALACSRMTELGGYFNYLVMAKQSNKKGDADGAVSSSNIWP